jgi:hypothetical protein
LKKIEEDKLSRIHNYGEIEAGRYILSICNGRRENKLKLFRAWEHPRELRLFLV